MDSLGYAVEELLALSEIKDDLKEQATWKRWSRIVVLTIITLLFLAFCGYQIRNVILSYKNPVWTSGEEDTGIIGFPGIVLCPPAPKFMNQSLHHGSCDYFDGLNGDNTENCAYEEIILYTFSTGAKVKCLAYNFNGNATTNGPEGFISISVNVSGNNNFLMEKPHSEENEFSVRPNKINFPLSIQLFDAEKGLPDEHVHPTFLVSLDSTNYVLVSKTEYRYLNKSTSATYDASTSSIPNPSQGIQLEIWFSFGSTRTTVWEQMVSEDYITVIGIIAGALGFMKSLYVIIFLIVDKIHTKCTSKKEKKVKDEDEDVLPEKKKLLSINDYDDEEQ